MMHRNRFGGDSRAMNAWLDQYEAGGPCAYSEHMARRAIWQMVRGVSCAGLERMLSNAIDEDRANDAASFLKERALRRDFVRWWCGGAS